MSRKLAAILSADVAGYSRLMAEDEAATISALNRARQLYQELVRTHSGRIIDTAGDSVLADFASAVEAVRCARELQDRLSGMEAALPEGRRMQFRIGVNLGDVVEESGSLYGDGVNVAARVQALAPPGGVCISGTVFDQVDGKLPMRFTFIGEQQVKNIPKPVRVYRLLSEAEPDRRSRVSVRKAAVVAVILFSVVAGGALYTWKPGPSPGPVVLSVDPSLAMPSGPRIAVFPLTNMSGDSREDYFSDGLTEDIITALARTGELHVLARNTTFQYKGRAVNVAAVGRQLGVQYVLEGSVRKTGTRLRITAQLIDVNTGSHLWADRYDRQYKDIFDLQDEITGKVVGAVAGGGGAVEKAARAAAAHKRPEELAAYDLVLQARSKSYFSREFYPEAKLLLQQAVRTDPSYARAREEYAWLRLLGFIFRHEGGDMPPEEMKQNAIKAVDFDPADPLAHRTAAFGYFFDHQMRLFQEETRRAFELAPYNAEIFAQLGALTVMSGDYDHGMALVDKATKLNALSAAGWSHSAAFYDHYRRGEYARAIEVIGQHPVQGMCETIHKHVSAYGQLGQPEKAREHWSKCLAIESDFSPDRVRQLFRIWNHPDWFARRYMEGFAKAGLPCVTPSCGVDSE